MPQEHVRQTKKVTDPAILEFDTAALLVALDEKRQEEGLSWKNATWAIWETSSALNLQRGDHPISPSTITWMAKHHDTSCQHALFMLRWLLKTPEEFLHGGPGVYQKPLPVAGLDQRLRWNFSLLYEALNEQRKSRGVTWKDLATELGCTTSQLSHIRTARFGMSMLLAMRIVQWLQRPAADFVCAVKW